MARLGMDVDVLRTTVTQMNASSARLDAVSAGVDAQLGRLMSGWFGTDAQQFQQVWNSQHKPAMRKLSQEVREMTKKLATNIEAQQSTSDTLGGGSGGSGSHHARTTHGGNHLNEILGNAGHLIATVSGPLGAALDLAKLAAEHSGVGQLEKIAGGLAKFDPVTSIAFAVPGMIDSGVSGVNDALHQNLVGMLGSYASLAGATLKAGAPFVMAVPPLAPVGVGLYGLGAISSGLGVAMDNAKYCDYSPSSLLADARYAVQGNNFAEAFGEGISNVKLDQWLSVGF